ncbi:MAG: hypothetical protein ACOX2L_08750 [Anaerolineae bacterium]|jgi:hypothetical protein|nr:hypothetical protein [Chloroflexota bacterium]
MAGLLSLTGRQSMVETGVRIARLRRLPRPGVILVQPGDTLAPADPVGRYASQESIVVIDLARALQVAPSAVRRYQLVSPGQLLEPDTLVAAGRRWPGLPLRVRAGVKGEVIDVEAGSLFVRCPAAYLPLLAYIPGRVREVYLHRAALVETEGHVLHGIWGAGGEGHGRLRVQGQRGAMLFRQHITEGDRGTILACGMLASDLALRRAAQVGLAGLVLGALHPDLRQACRAAPFPVMVTEGMGRTPMAPPAWEMLQRLEGKLAVLAGDGRLTATGPELIVPEPLPLTGLALAPPLAPGIGSQVRLTAPEHLGLVGEIVSLAEQQPLRSGTLTPAAWVRLADRRMMLVALENLEVLATVSADPFALLRSAPLRQPGGPPA